MEDHFKEQIVGLAESRIAGTDCGAMHHGNWRLPCGQCVEHERTMGALLLKVANDEAVRRHIEAGHDARDGNEPRSPHGTKAVKKRPSVIDKRRLWDGRRALELGIPARADRRALSECLQILKDGATALQSLDDLGPDANDKASADFLAIQIRIKGVDEALSKLGDGT